MCGIAFLGAATTFARLLCQCRALTAERRFVVVPVLISGLPIGYVRI